MKIFRLFLAPFVVVAAFAIAALPAGANPSITTGDDHACAVNDVGAAFCWGANDLGQLGNGNTSESHAPVAVAGLPAAVSSIYGGSKSTCALLIDKTVWCWGNNQEGELGNNVKDLTNIAHPTPTKVSSLSGVTQISGAKTTYCALLADATERCWGGSGYGEVGNGVSGTDIPTPTAATGLSGVRYIAAGYAHTCAIMLDGTGRCWGYNAGGILGTGSFSPPNSSTPLTVSGLSGAVSARLSGYSSCALLQSGGIKCWGQGSFLGNNLAVSSSPSPVDVLNLAGAYEQGGSNLNTCAIASPSQLKCWGDLPGNGTDGPAGTPVDVTGADGTLAVSSNGFNGNVCFVSRGGAAHCWGSSNQYGELGNGATSATSTKSPVGVVSLDLVTGSYASPSVSLVRTGKTKLDKKKKTYSQLATLTAFLPPLIGQADGCAGTVAGSVPYSYKTFKKVHHKRKRVTVKKTAKTKATFAASGWTCVATLTYKLPVKYLNHKRVTLKASWPGNGAMNAFSASAAKFTLPKVKPVKKKK
jgi:alpha-tubulin suppressor-like RCC1 family protein